MPKRERGRQTDRQTRVSCSDVYVCVCVLPCLLLMMALKPDCPQGSANQRSFLSLSPNIIPLSSLLSFSRIVVTSPPAVSDSQITTHGKWLLLPPFYFQTCVDKLHILPFCERPAADFWSETRRKETKSGCGHYELWINSALKENSSSKHLLIYSLLRYLF